MIYDCRPGLSTTATTKLSNQDPLVVNLTQIQIPPTFVESKQDDGSGEKFERIFGNPEDLSPFHRQALAEFDAVKQAQVGVVSNIDEVKVANEKKVEDLLALVSTKQAEDWVPIFITLPDVAFNWSELALREEGEQIREQILDVRKEQVRGITSHLTSQLAELGAIEIQDFWVIPSVFAYVKAKDVQTVIQWPSLLSVEYGVGPKMESQAPSSFHGVAARDAMKATALISAGYNGSAFARVGGPIRVGVLDGPNMVAHPGYGSRLTNFHCYGWGCGTVTPNGVLGHENSVARILAGSIENGEDPSITNQTERTKRSGYSAGSKLWVGGINDASTCASYIQSFQYAINQYLDVYNMSFSWGGGCSNVANPCGTAATLRNVAASGTVPVYALGNGTDNVPPNPPGSFCSVNFPATNRDGIAVAALHSDSSAINYDTVNITPVSARGGMDLTINGGVHPKAAAVADISAPGGYDFWYNSSPGYGYYSSTDSCCYTSFSAPAVSGAVSLLRHALRSSNFTLSSSNALITHFLMLGDGWDYDLNAVRVRGVSSRSGVGRAHLRYPSSNNITSPWKWSYGTTSLGPGDIFTVSMTDGGLPLPAGISQLKVVMKFTEPTYTNAADLDIYVYNTCPPGGGISYMGDDTSRDIVSRIDLRSGLAGKCPALWVRSFHVPSGQTRTADFAFLYHAGTPD
jgi:hypothetical protein